MRRRQDHGKAKRDGGYWTHLLLVTERMARDYKLDGAEEVIELLQRKKDGCRNTARDIACPNAMKHDLLFFDDSLSTLNQIPHTMLEMRTMFGMSQEELADKLGWSVKTVIRYENSNYSNAPLKRLLEYAAFFRKHKEASLERRSEALRLAQMEKEGRLQE